MKIELRDIKPFAANDDPGYTGGLFVDEQYAGLAIDEGTGGGVFFRPQGADQARGRDLIDAARVALQGATYSFECGDGQRVVCDLSLEDVAAMLAERHFARARIFEELRELDSQERLLFVDNTSRLSGPTLMCMRSYAEEVIQTGRFKGKTLREVIQLDHGADTPILNDLIKSDPEAAVDAYCRACPEGVPEEATFDLDAHLEYAAEALPGIAP